MTPKKLWMPSSAGRHRFTLSMVQIEVGVMASLCLDRRMPTKAFLFKEVKAWGTSATRDKSPA